MEAVSELKHNKIIHVFGSTGGHRDISKREIFGRTSAEFADHIIVTNDDVYDSDPEEIARSIELGIKQQISQSAGQLISKSANRQVKYEIILDRKEAVTTAISKAEKGDLVLITGKGSEQFLVLPGNKRIEWDDREVVRSVLKQVNSEK